MHRAICSKADKGCRKIKPKSCAQRTKRPETVNRSKYQNKNLNVLTYSNFVLVLEELEADKCGGEEGDVGVCHTLPEKTEISVQSAHAIRTSGSPEAAFGLFVPLVYPIQGETVEQGSVFVIGTHLDEFALAVFIGLLEDGED